MYISSSTVISNEHAEAQQNALRFKRTRFWQDIV